MKGFLSYPVLQLSLYLLDLVTGKIFSHDLSGDDWTATSTSLQGTSVTRIPKATVPGCIHTDWYNHIGRNKVNNPFYRFNDDTWRNISEKNWAYEKTFSVNKHLTRHKEQWLVCEGLDTIANISLNSKLLGSSRNMFVRYFFNVTGMLQKNFNGITIAFESATKYANDIERRLKYPIPPECPPEVQHGFCHVNLLRKQQSSFSWDWGPGFATQGIWKPIYLVGIDEVLVTDISLSYDWADESMSIHTRYLLTGASYNVHGTITLNIDELFIRNVNHAVLIDAKSPTVTVLQHIPKKDVKLWWPNGHGEQKLYNVTVDFLAFGSKDHFSKTIWFGFRKVDLVQSTVNGSAGLSFYLKINDHPIFAKGSNWIPADAFPSRVVKNNYTNLLQSAKDANMNILRVWGGGVYERDEFYELADSMGIMIWHDFMFACAMYPSEREFLESVSQEITDAIWRLRSHPSVVLWAGNNENEAALATNWYNTSGMFEIYRKDYIALYVETIGKVVADLDSTRPYLTSSPTNGYETKKEGWIAKNPYDTHYGDTHYYNYDLDCLDWTKFPKARFASEYGYQSFSSIQTMLQVAMPSDLIWDSTFIIQRNHHSDGNSQIFHQISRHFNITSAKTGEERFKNLVYLSQIMQGLCYKSETEFYRRSQSEIVHGEGHTMGALYWQLNDVWQTTSWSSIEYGGKWKAVHYLAKKFFANIALSAFHDGTSLSVYCFSDNTTAITSVTLVIETHLWSKFGIVHQWRKNVSIPPQSSTMLYNEDVNIMMHYAGCEKKAECYFVIYIEELPDVSTYFYPVSFKSIVGMTKPAIQVTDVILLPSASSPAVMQEYQVHIVTTSPAFFVFLEAYETKGRFSDNAFHCNTRTNTVIFYAWEITSASALKSSIHIMSLADASLGDDSLGIAATSKHKPKLLGNSASSDEEPTVWLDNVQAKLTFGLCGLLFLLFFATLLVCVIMRFNPYLYKPGAVVTRPETRKLPPRHEDEDLPDDNDSSGAFLMNLRDPRKPKERDVNVAFYIH